MVDDLEETLLQLDDFKEKSIWPIYVEVVRLHYEIIE